MHQVYCFVLANCPHCAGLSVDKLEWTGEKITLTRFCLDNGEARPDPIKADTSNGLTIRHDGIYSSINGELTRIAGAPIAILANEQMTHVCAAEPIQTVWDKRFMGLTMEMIDLLDHHSPVTICYNLRTAIAASR